jgi:predicted nucleic acid-binding Zn finger protein
MPLVTGASARQTRARGSRSRSRPASGAMHAPSAWAATPGTVERTPRAPGLGAAFVPLSATAVADAIFDEIRLSGTETRPPELTDRHLEVLASIFDEKHLSNALELVQNGKVKRLVAHRSRRWCFQVAGRTAKETYLCYPDAFCSCRAFQWDVISRGEKVACKHQLAVKVATAVNVVCDSEVTDLLMAQLLEAYARGGGEKKQNK